MIMAKPDLGTKRACLACGMRFYDFNRSSIICPGCGAAFDPDAIVKSHKMKPARKPAHDIDDDATDDDQIDTDAEDGQMISADVDDDIDFDDDDDVDVDDDGPGIIQDDITDGDELLPNLDDKDEN